jgi:ABC-type multidrug transport system fused ATPase/permease subunit
MAVSIPSTIITFTYRHKNVRYMRWRSKERRQMDYYSGLMVNKDMVKELRLYDLSDTFIDRYDDAFERYYKGMRRLIIGEGGWHVGFALLSSVVNCIFFAMIAYRVFTGEIMIGDYTLLTGALTSIAGSVSTLISASSTVYEGTLFIDNLMTFMDYEQTIAPRIATPLKVRHGEQHTIVFDHVSFRYPGTERDVLKDINMTLVPGESLVLVGLNGAGKTTLLKLLTRLYDPTEGRILLDGEDLRDYDVQDLYRMFGIIFQDFGKYAESAGENIHFGNISKLMEEKELREAAEASGAAEFIDAFPEGYATPLMRIFEQEGMELSGGQWQKLAISRAFYSDCDVLILDEPTAALDALAEQEIYNQFDRLRQGKTTIFVSHRLSSATVASKIVVLEYGTIIEEGNHRTLMQKQGRYFELFSTQAARYREDV